MNILAGDIAILIANLIILGINIKIYSEIVKVAELRRISNDQP